MLKNKNKIFLGLFLSSIFIFSILEAYQIGFVRGSVSYTVDTDLIEYILANLGGGMGAKNEYFAFGSSGTGVSSPVAYYYNGITYVVYQAWGDNDPYIIAYTHSSMSWSDPVRVGDNPIGATDNHGDPCVIVDDSGYIHVFWGHHSFTGNNRHAKSVSAENISSWTLETDVPVGDSTYPCLVKDSDGYIYYFYRYAYSATQSDFKYVYSDDDGDSWSSAVTLASFGSGWSLYHGNVEFDSINNKMWFTWYKRTEPSSDVRYDCYVANLDLDDSKCYSTGGTDLGVSIDKTEAETYCRVYSGDANTTFIPQIRLDSDSYPYVIYSDNGGVWNYQCNYKFIRWNGASWTSAVSILSGLPLYATSGADFILVNDTYIEAYLCVNASYMGFYKNNNWRGGNLYRFISSDSGATWKIERVIKKAEDFPICYPFVVQNYVDDFKIVFYPENVIWDTEFYDLRGRIYGWGEDGFV